MDTWKKKMKTGTEKKKALASQPGWPAADRGGTSSVTLLPNELSSLPSSTYDLVPTSIMGDRGETFSVAPTPEFTFLACQDTKLDDIRVQPCDSAARKGPSRGRGDRGGASSATHA